ncbi:MAG: HNH endonuclease [Candidatus Cloacimonadota bacterium]|nr:MAG: HNH endonuclease [Candidatus Cloacimonadota bacterium]
MTIEELILKVRREELSINSLVWDRTNVKWVSVKDIFLSYYSRKKKGIPGWLKALLIVGVGILGVFMIRRTIDYFRPIRPKYTDEELSQIFDKTKERCYYCSKKLYFKNYGKFGMCGDWEVAHITAKVRGGRYIFGNLVASCIKCNRSIGPLHPSEL